MPGADAETWQSAVPMASLHCNICETDCDATAVKTARVRSNVRKFADETFELWRCPQCASIHASDEVDLAHYYADYPFHHLDQVGLDWRMRAMYAELLARLGAAGVTAATNVLDYGCGSGLFLSYLQDRGFGDLSGYDEYSERYTDRAALERRYDLVMSQDVVEHVEQPWEHLATLDTLTAPGGVIAIGTPNAESIDLEDVEARVHTLHQPYHRHMLSSTALQKVGERFGWELLKYYPTMYSNTRVPFVNAPFVNHYFKCFDNNLDLVVEPIQVGSWKLWTPVTLWHALFGSLYAAESDVMAVFRKPN